MTDSVCITLPPSKQTSFQFQNLAPSKEHLIHYVESMRPKWNRDLQPPIGQKPQQPPAPWDDCRLGYRNVPYFNMKSYEWISDQVGLTPEDLLYPRLGDKVMRGNAFSEEAIPIYLTIKRLLKTYVRHGHVFWDVGVDWQHPNFEKHHAPDIAVYYNMPANLARSNDLTLIKVRDLGLDPRFAIEYISHSSPEVVDNDRVHKFRDYYTVGVPQYIMIDVTTPKKGPRTVDIKVYERGLNKYELVQPNLKDRVRLNFGPELNVWIGKASSGPHQTVALFEGGHGRRIRDLDLSEKEVSKQFNRADREKARAETAEARAEAAEARIRALEAMLQSGS